MHECARAPDATTRAIVGVSLAVRHLLVAVACAGSAFAQPPAPQESLETLSRPVTPSAFDVTFGDTALAPLKLDMKVSPAPRFVIECPRCSADDRFAPSPTSNAPWSAGIGTSFDVGRTRVGLALLGSRNYRLPRYMAQPLGTTADTTPAWAASYSDLASNRTEWTVSARVQRTLKTLRGGQTIGVVGDAWTPVNTGPDPARILGGAAAPSITDMPLLPSKTVRFGVTFAF